MMITLTITHPEHTTRSYTRYTWEHALLSASQRLSVATYHRANFAFRRGHQRYTCPTTGVTIAYTEHTAVSGG